MLPVLSRKLLIASPVILTLPTLYHILKRILRLSIFSLCAFFGLSTWLVSMDFDPMNVILATIKLATGSGLRLGLPV